MKTISYANFFYETPAPFIDKNLLKQINLNIKHASGIYKISNVITGDCYIGQSKDIFTRIGQHKSLLKHNKHKYKNGDFKKQEDTQPQYQTHTMQPQSQPQYQVNPYQQY